MLLTKDDAQDTQIETSTSEAAFDPSWLLASATDLRGVIRCANAAFCKVSGYAEDALIGAPHKIVRHPDTPRGVFHLIWDRLTNGLPVFAYIKNRCANGQYYWVFAMLTRHDQTLMSVRIKPQSPLFETTKQIYQTMLEAEAGGLSAEKSAELFLTELAAMGFASHEAQMSTALDAEITARADIPQTARESLSALDDLSTLIRKADGRVAEISGVFNQVRGEPVNLRILAGRMEETGAAIATISKNYETMTAEMFSLVSRLTDPETGVLTRMMLALDQARFAAQASTIMRLNIAQCDEPGSSSTTAVFATTMAEHADHLSARCRTALNEIVAVGQSIPETSRQLRRRVNGLDLVKLLCRVESGRLGDSDSGLNGIISRLESAHQNADRILGELSTISEQINARSRAF